MKKSIFAGLLSIFITEFGSTTEVRLEHLQNALSPIFFTEFVRERKLKEITEDVIGQMEASMVLFALKNDAVELYQKYLKSTFIPKRELVYHYVDEQGEEHYLRQDEFDEFNGEQPENGEEVPENAQPEVPAPVKTPEEYDLAREQLVCLKEFLLFYQLFYCLYSWHIIIPQTLTPNR